MILAAVLRELVRIILPPLVHGIEVSIALVMWWIGILLEALILFRARQTKAWSKYRFFYTYITVVILSDILLYPIYVMRRAWYAKWSWSFTFLDVILALGIILEILEHAIPCYQGAEGVGKVGSVGRRIIWGTALCQIVICGLIVSGAWKGRLTNIEIKRDLVGIQAIFILAMVGVIFYYAIPIGGNLTGMVLGYGLCVGAGLVILTLRIYIGPAFNPIWYFVGPFSYLLTLGIWLFTLWNADADPVLVRAPDVLEQCSESFASRTRIWMRGIFAFPASVVRP